MLFKLYSFFLCISITHILNADMLTIINSTAGQISVTIQTQKQEVTAACNPDENQFLNDINNSQATQTSLNFEPSPIEMIIIRRNSTTLPQIICNTFSIKDYPQDHHDGLHYLEQAGNAILQVWQDAITLHNEKYNLYDINSFIIYCNNIIQQHQDKNSQNLNKKIETIEKYITEIDESDKADALSVSIEILKASLHRKKNYTQLIESLQSIEEKIVKLDQKIQNQDILETEHRTQGLPIGQTMIECKDQIIFLKNLLLSAFQTIHENQIHQYANTIMNKLLHTEEALHQKMSVQFATKPEELINKQQEWTEEQKNNLMQYNNNTFMGYAN